MKGKPLALFLAVSCVLSMTACGGGTVQTDNPLIDGAQTQDEAVLGEAATQKDIGNAEDTGDSEKSGALTEASASEETEALVSENTDTGEEAAGAGEETKQETYPEAETETLEEEKPSSVSNASAELSDNLYDFQLSIDGCVYQIPMQYSDFEALGWEYDGDDTDTLSANQYVPLQRWKKDGGFVYTKFSNMSMNTKAFSESMVGGIRMDRYMVKDCDWEIVLPGAVQWGVSNADDIKAAYGEPTSDYDGNSYYKMTYRYGYYQEINLYVYKDTGVLEQIDIENLVEPEHN